MASSKHLFRNWNCRKRFPNKLVMIPFLEQVSCNPYPESGLQSRLPQLTHIRWSGRRGNQIFIGGKTEIQTVSLAQGKFTASYATSFWEIMCNMQDGRGDGTVPASSGMAPRRDGGAHVRQQFRLEGFSHEPSYKNPTAQRVTHYAITKICALAKLA